MIGTGCSQDRPLLGADAGAFSDRQGLNDAGERVMTQGDRDFPRQHLPQPVDRLMKPTISQ